MQVDLAIFSAQRICRLDGVHGNRKERAAVNSPFSNVRWTVEPTSYSPQPDRPHPLLCRAVCHLKSQKRGPFVPPRLRVGANKCVSGARLRGPSPGTQPSRQHLLLLPCAHMAQRAMLVPTFRGLVLAFLSPSLSAEGQARRHRLGCQDMIVNLPEGELGSSRASVQHSAVTEMPCFCAFPYGSLAIAEHLEWDGCN